MINSYEFGKMVIDGKEYRKDLIIYPDRVRENWRRKSGHKLMLEDIEEILKEKPELVVVGKGYSGMMKVLPEVERRLKEENIELRVETTGKSWGIFNEVSKHSRTIGAFHLTC